jgi:D-alanine-D-alanine ligase-like ATP-grasp enzyme
MIDELHPSFIPFLEKASKVTGLSIAGFDCIIPDPTKDESSQRWGIIECNTLPFIDMHYYALEGKPRNIAGMIWDLWK